MIRSTKQVMQLSYADLLNEYETACFAVSKDPDAKGWTLSWELCRSELAFRLGVLIDNDPPHKFKSC